MDQPSLNSRLSRISTRWGLLAAAGGSLHTAVRNARLALIERYQGAAYRYLLAAVRDPDVADDLFQEFALRCLQGAFRRADSRRGRFRDYLKTTLYHLIVDYQGRRRRAPQPLDTDIQPTAAEWDAGQSDRHFIDSWREELLERAWAALLEAEQQGGQPFYTVLKARADAPDASSTDLAARVNERLSAVRVNGLPAARPYTETAARKALQRARARFSDALLDEVVRSLDNPPIEALEEELIDLDLLAYCRSALARRKGGPSRWESKNNGS